MSSYFEDGLFGSQIGNDINNDIVIEAYQSLERSEMDQIGAMPPAMPPSMPPFSPQHFPPPHHPASAFLNQGMGAWDPTFPSGQFGNLPAEPRALFVDPELCDRTMDNDDMRSQIQALEAEVSRRPSTRSQIQALEAEMSRRPSTRSQSQALEAALEAEASRRPSTRRTSSSKSESQSSTRSDNSLTDITPPDQSQPKKRRSNKKKGPSEGEDMQKRNKFLERNRIAASKCREKKKKSMSDLEQTKMELEVKNTNLQTEHRNLASMVANLKHELMTHAKCDDPRINKWLTGQAEQYVHTPAPAPPAPSSRRLSDQGYTGFNPPGPPALPAESPRGGKGYTVFNLPGPPVLSAESPRGGQGYTGFPPPGPPVLPADSPRGRQPSLPTAYHPMHPGSFPMGHGEGQNALYDAMGAAAEGQLRSFDAMVARDSQSGQFGLMGAGERQNSIAYSHGE